MKGKWLTALVGEGIKNQLPSIGKLLKKNKKQNNLSVSTNEFDWSAPLVGASTHHKNDSKLQDRLSDGGGGGVGNTCALFRGVYRCLWIGNFTIHKCFGAKWTLQLYKQKALLERCGGGIFHPHHQTRLHSVRTTQIEGGREGRKEEKEGREGRKEEREEIWKKRGFNWT